MCVAVDHPRHQHSTAAIDGFVARLNKLLDRPQPV